ncbi:M15 family metallopeptidase [Wukongibacter baidiensis]|uniref:S8 family serine peptidase n=1 Tax=Wukongibacter baidiensis TaxID=1723361 RepID=UPI003D7FDD63
MRYIKENLKEFEICNITKWHELGYTGKGIKIAEIESCISDLWIFDGMLRDPFNIGENAKMNSHGQKVLDVIHQVAPDSELYMLPSGINASGTDTSGSLINETLKFAIKEGIHIINASLGGVDNKKLNREIFKVQEYGTVFVTSGGNDGEKGTKGFAKSNVWISVAAVHLKSKNYKIERPTYSSTGKALDFSSFSNLFIHNAKEKERVFPVQGTSFSSPMFAAMLALVQQFFKEKAGRTLYQDEIYIFVQDHCLDLGEIGYDEYHGYGLFILPLPKEIDVNKYMIKEGDEEVSKVIKDLDRLHSYVGALAGELIRKSKENGVEIIVTETFRTKERQQELYNQGRTTPGQIVTNAKPGDSIHNYGLAFDIVPVEKGKALWDRYDLFKKVGAIGVALGLEWGGNWRSFKDYPHFQWTGGLTLKDLKAGKLPVDPNSEISEWAKEAQNWVMNEGISDGTNPKGLVTREQFWTMLYRYHQKYNK